jgi:hypothetical protein
LKIEASFDSHGSLTLIFPELSGPDSVHLGYLAGQLEKLRVPVMIASEANQTILHVGISHDARPPQSRAAAFPFSDPRADGGK